MNIRDVFSIFGLLFDSVPVLLVCSVLSPYLIFSIAYVCCAGDIKSVEAVAEQGCDARHQVLEVFVLCI